MPSIAPAASTPAEPSPLDSDGDAGQTALNQWISESGSDEQWLVRTRVSQSLQDAMAVPPDDAPVDLDVEDVGALELPPQELLRSAGLTAPSLKATVDFSEPQDQESLLRSLDALAVEHLAVSRLANGQMPPGSRLDTVRVLDFSGTEGDVPLQPLVTSLADWPSLQSIIPPPSLAPSGFTEKISKLRPSSGCG